MFSHWIPHIDKLKNIFRPRDISGNPPRSRDRLRHYLRSPEPEIQQFQNLIILIDSSFKCDHFLLENLILSINRSQDIRVQNLENPGIRLQNLILQNSV